jgi:hypothetical protein
MRFFEVEIYICYVAFPLCEQPAGKATVQAPKFISSFFRTPSLLKTDPNHPCKLNQ